VILAQLKQLLQWRSILDIVVVAVVVYQFFMLIKGTRAVQLLNGLIILLVVSNVSDYLHLGTISWMLDQVWKVLFFALPVVFQPELRRALEHLGRGKFFVRHPTTVGTEDLLKMINELIRCTQVLSKNRIGALLVLERQTGIQDIINTGIQINGVISSEFLVNIFVPNTPLHDGAVVIRGNRVEAAGCFLPLSENPNILKELGTRHRAALGLSEIGDALIVIVSEETGAISVAMDGNLTRFLDEKALKDLLMRELQVEKTNSSIWSWRRSS
jgi:diadenylate cyclase